MCDSEALVENGPFSGLLARIETFTKQCSPEAHESTTPFSFSPASLCYLSAKLVGAHISNTIGPGGASVGIERILSLFAKPKAPEPAEEEAVQTNSIVAFCERLQSLKITPAGEPYNSPCELDLSCFPSLKALEIDRLGAATVGNGGRNTRRVVSIASSIDFTPFIALEAVELRECRGFIDTKQLHYLSSFLEEIRVTQNTIAQAEEILRIPHPPGWSSAPPLMWLRLRVLDISYNGLTELDDSLSLAPSLEELICHHNDIQEVDCSILLCGCLKLQKWDLSHNKLRSIQGLEHLSNLYHLDLSHNELSSLQEVAHLANTWPSSLQSLCLQENPISGMENRSKILAFFQGKTEFWLDGEQTTTTCFLNHTPNEPDVQDKPTDQDDTETIHSTSPPVVSAPISCELATEVDDGRLFHASSPLLSGSTFMPFPPLSQDSVKSREKPLTSTKPKKKLSSLVFLPIENASKKLGTVAATTAPSPFSESELDCEQGQDSQSRPFRPVFFRLGRESPVPQCELDPGLAESPLNYEGEGEESKPLFPTFAREARHRVRSTSWKSQSQPVLPGVPSIGVSEVSGVLPLPSSKRRWSFNRNQTAVSPPSTLSPNSSTGSLYSRRNSVHHPLLILSSAIIPFFDEVMCHGADLTHQQQQHHQRCGTDLLVQDEQLRLFFRLHLFCENKNSDDTPAPLTRTRTHSRSSITKIPSTCETTLRPSTSTGSLENGQKDDGSAGSTNGGGGGGGNKDKGTESLIDYCYTNMVVLSPAGTAAQSVEQSVLLVISDSHIHVLDDRNHKKSEDSSVYHPARRRGSISFYDQSIAEVFPIRYSQEISSLTKISSGHCLYSFQLHFANGTSLLFIPRSASTTRACLKSIFAALDGWTMKNFTPGTDVLALMPTFVNDTLLTQQLIREQVLRDSGTTIDAYFLFWILSPPSDGGQLFPFNSDPLPATTYPARHVGASRPVTIIGSGHMIFLCEEGHSPPSFHVVAGESVGDIHHVERHTTSFANQLAVVFEEICADEEVRRERWVLVAADSETKDAFIGWLQRLMTDIFQATLDIRQIRNANSRTLFS